MKRTSKISPIQRQTSITESKNGQIVFRDVSMESSPPNDVLDVTKSSQYTDYYDSIIADDYESVGQFLSLSDGEEKARLLNLPFRFPSISLGKNDATEDEWFFEVRYPVLLAAVVGSHPGPGHLHTKRRQFLSDRRQWM